MKKTLCLLLSLLLMVSAGAAAFAEGEAQPAESARRDVPLDSEEFATLQHEVYAANELEALLEKYESVTFDMTDAPDNDHDNWRDYIYITRDGCYFETPVSAEYHSDRMFFILTDSDEGPSRMTYGLDVTSDYDLFEIAGFQYFPSGQEEFWKNNEFEEHVACYFEDGLLFMRDRMDAASGEAWFAEHLPFETYDGEIVYSEIVCDAETCELIEFNYYLEDKDGGMERVVNHTAAYDEPEPRRMRNMRMAFGRYCENTIDVTIVADPGTDHEFSKGVTLPVGSVFNYRSDNPGKAVLFNDPDATTLTHFDGMKDTTFYIFTDPTEEQTERYQALVQAILDAQAE